jgi:hypothetical protein
MILYATSFDWYRQSYPYDYHYFANMLNEFLLYTSGLGPNPPSSLTNTKVSTGASLNAQSFNTRASFITKVPNRDELYVQLRYAILETAADIVLLELAYNETDIISVYQERETGKLKVFSGEGTGGTLFCESDVFVASSFEWNRLELHVKLHDTNGIIEMRMNGLDICSYSGNTKVIPVSNYFNIVRISGIYNAWSPGPFLQDFIIYDTTGNKNNSWINGARVKMLRPNADGFYSQWTPQSGYHYSNVRDNGEPVTTKYVKTNVAGKKDSYKFDSLPEKARKIVAIWPVCVGHRDTSNTPTKLRQFIRYNNQDYIFGQNMNIPLEFMGLLKTEILETNPATGENFTVDDINNIEIGIESIE